MSGGFDIEGQWSDERPSTGLDESKGGVRYYDKPRDDMPKVDLPPPPPRPAEPAELAKAGLVTMPPPAEDARFKTIEATLTDVVRRLKALEERVIDPSV